MLEWDSAQTLSKSECLPLFKKGAGKRQSELVDTLQPYPYPYPCPTHEKCSSHQSYVGCAHKDGQGGETDSGNYITCRISRETYIAKAVILNTFPWE